MQNIAELFVCLLSQYLNKKKPGDGWLTTLQACLFIKGLDNVYWRVVVLLRFIFLKIVQVLFKMKVII